MVSPHQLFCISLVEKKRETERERERDHGADGKEKRVDEERGTGAR